MFELGYDVKSNDRYLTADIAGRGSDKFVVGAWYGKELVDILIMDKSNGPDVVNGIKKMAEIHRVPNHHIIYDADGIGGLVDGFIVGAIPFIGNSIALEVYDKNARQDIREQYQNLKTQLVYRSGAAVDRGEYRIAPEVYEKMYDKRMSVKQRFVYERKAFKRDKVDKDGKLRILPKDKMKVILQNESPDVMDMFYLREYFELKPPQQSTASNWSQGFL
jgi:hypothetical protein